MDRWPRGLDPGLGFQGGYPGFQIRKLSILIALVVLRLRLLGAHGWVHLLTISERSAQFSDIYWRHLKLLCKAFDPRGAREVRRAGLVRAQIR